ncbi:GGDEF domain-containing protein [Paenibacillus sp. sgz500958]|uniref:GGDEF domain-containing protein n=1 Tax=Paenibacillus sp. sgz500958 TaxID=3242475 RepID=UPI0036D42D94
MAKFRKHIALLQVPASVVMTEIRLVNLKRIIYAAVVLAPLHLLCALVFSGFSPSSASAAEWRSGIMLGHYSMAGAVLVLAGCAWWLQNNRLTTAWGCLLTLFGTWLYLGLGIYLTSQDQLVNSGMTPFVIICLALAVVLRIHPLSALISYVTAYTVFYFSISYTQPHPDIVLSLRINAVCTVLVSIGISWIMWRQNLKLIYMRRKVAHRQSRLKLKNRQLHYLAGHDALTGLLNRMQFRKEAYIEIERMRRSGQECSMIILDIDRFKGINDHYGHPVGDKVLTDIAGIIRSTIDQQYICARLGGEEFIMLLYGAKASDAFCTARLLCTAIGEYSFRTEDIAVHVTASFGVAAMPVDDVSPLDQAYKRVDKALYRAKEKGGNTVEMAS